MKRNCTRIQVCTFLHRISLAVHTFDISMKTVQTRFMLVYQQIPLVKACHWSLWYSDCHFI